MAHGQKAIGIKIGIVVVLLLSLTSPAAAQVCDQPPAGLIGWWTGDIAGTDSAGNPPNHAELQNGASAGAAGKVDEAFSFDGIDDIATTSLILPSKGTVDFWVNPTTLSGGIDGFLGTLGQGGGNDRLWIAMVGPSTIKVNLGSGAVDDISAFFPLPIGQWTHLALSFDYDNAVYILYVDGEPVAASGAPRIPPSQPFGIGGVRSNFGQNFFFNGLIDEVEVFDRVLAGSEIMTIFSAGTAGGCKFADFTLKKAEVKFDKKGGVDDQFKVEGEFTLHPDTNGINLTTDDVVVGVGTGLVTIPAESFMAVGSKHKFEGVLGGVSVKMRIKEIGFDQYSFKVKAKGMDLTDTANPIDILLRIGNDVGEAIARLKGKLRLPKGSHKSDDD